MKHLKWAKTMGKNTRESSPKRKLQVGIKCPHNPVIFVHFMASSSLPFHPHFLHFISIWWLIIELLIIMLLLAGLPSNNALHIGNILAISVEKMGDKEKSYTFWKTEKKLSWLECKLVGWSGREEKVENKVWSISYYITLLEFRHSKKV